MNMDRAEPGLPAKVYPALHGRRGFGATRVSRRHQYTNRAASAKLVRIAVGVASGMAGTRLPAVPSSYRAGGTNPGGAWRGVCVERSVPSGGTASLREVVRPPDGRGRDLSHRVRKSMMLLRY